MWQERERDEVRLRENYAPVIGQTSIGAEIMKKGSEGRHCLDLAAFALDYSPPRSIPLASNVRSFTAWATYLHRRSAGTLMYASLQYRYQVLLDDCIDRLCEAMAPARTALNDERARTPLASSASSPSLRSRTAVARPMTPPNNMTPGGNVKVVVRVRGFLPRGEQQQELSCTSTNAAQRLTVAHNALSRWIPTHSRPGS